MLDSVFITGNNYCPQVFLEECKYAIKEKKIYDDIIDDVKLLSDSDEETLLEKNSGYEENSDEEILKQIQVEKDSDYEETFDVETLEKI